LGNIVSFTAGSAITVNGKKAIPLEYTGLNVTGNFDTGAVEKLYRAEIVGKTGINNSGITGNTVTNWTAIDLVWTTDGVANTRSALDTSASLKDNTYYAYTLVLDKGGLLSNAITAVGTVDTENVPSIGTITVTPYTALNTSNGDPTGSYLSISFLGDKDATYTLERAPNIGSDDTGNAKPGTFVPVSTTAYSPGVDGIVIIPDTGVTKRTAWYYKVTATRDTVTNTRISTIYSSVPYTAFGAATYTPGVTVSRPSSTTLSFEAIGLGTAALSSEIFSGESLVVYFRPSTGTPGPYATSLSISYANLTTDTAAGVTYPVPTPVTVNQYLTYDYQVYIRSGDLLLEISGASGSL
jgi:hypothetical protein